MEANRCVHISHVSGETLGLVSTRPKHERVTFINALHYFAARRCDVPVWCVELVWEYDPWDEAQWPMKVHVQCVINTAVVMFDGIAKTTPDENRCCNCWEDCEDVEKVFGHVIRGYWGERDGKDPRDLNCDECAPQQLCDLCHVHLPGGGSSCLQCFTPFPEISETDRDYFARVVSFARRGLTDAQMNRWQCVRFCGE